MNISPKKFFHQGAYNVRNLTVFARPKDTADLVVQTSVFKHGACRKCFSASSLFRSFPSLFDALASSSSANHCHTCLAIAALPKGNRHLSSALQMYFHLCIQQMMDGANFEYIFNNNIFSCRIFICVFYFLSKKFLLDKKNALLLNDKRSIFWD